ncbi:Helix-turn-helix domain protein [Corynebacterium occultum]|uniref:Helix-turn-helix domain protein n=1 Tax=Corynebacterium occultum TaxID=2675219 RepID=A0A6B8VZ08_9CORY|nr:short-chain fatty acyl-CoA regulator family protein [Corynebacterium occultum]QGU06554.1 Helix-turn-helix domain protein [Corynebacterium occultum]
MSKLFAGARIRTLRRSAHLTQVEMARQLNLSTSYLNQIENDQRPLTATVLMALTANFEVEASYFSPDQDARTVADLQSAFPQVPAEQLSDLASRYPDLVAEIIETNTHGNNREEGPYEAVRDFFYDARNYIDELDRLGENLAAELGDPQFRLSRMAALLDATAGVSVRFRRHSTGPRRIYHPDTRELHLRTGLTDAQNLFEIALQYALLIHDELLHRLATPLPDASSREVGRLGLAQYFAASVVLPYSSILRVAEETHYDIDRIAAHFGTGIETTCHRLSTLQRRGQRGIPFFFIRTDRAGNISKRQSATSFHFSRSGGSCPLWVIHRAFEQPNRFVRQVASMPDGRSYLWVARTVQGPAHGFGTPRREFVVGLGCDLSQADRLVYSQGLEMNPESATPIGPGCTACPRPHCPQRAFPQSERPLALDLNVTADEPYQTL